MAIMVGDASSTRIDMYSLGFSGRCKDHYRKNTGSLEAALAIEGRISTPKSKVSSRYSQITFDLEHENGGYVDRVRLDIHYVRQGHDLILTDRCSISGNGLTLMRGVLGDVVCGKLSFDGKANILGACHAALDAIEVQIPLLVQAFEFCSDFLNTAFPGWKPKAVWLKKIEACRDLQVDNAIGAMRIIQHSSLHGATHRLLDQYRRISDSEQKSLPVVGFIEQKCGPRAKYYAKRDHDLRVEFAAHDRVEVTALTGSQRADFSADGVRTLFLDFLTKVGPRLDQLEQHAREALRSETSITELIVSLKSIIDRAAGDRKVKGPASAKAAALAAQLLDALLSVGMCDAIGTHANHAIRGDLDALCTENGPLTRRVGRAIYYLKPKYARACSAIRSSSSTTATVQR